MTDGKRFEILLRKIAQVNNLANELQLNLDWPCKIAARSAITGWHKRNMQEIDLILTPPESDAVQ
jgi:hypothetical protein